MPVGCAGKTSDIIRYVHIKLLAFGVLSGCKKENTDSNVTTITMWTGDGGGKAIMVEFVNEFNNTK